MFKCSLKLFFSKCTSSFETLATFNVSTGHPYVIHMTENENDRSSLTFLYGLTNHSQILVCDYWLFPKVHRLGVLMEECLLRGLVNHIITMMINWKFRKCRLAACFVLAKRTAWRERDSGVYINHNQCLVRTASRCDPFSV